MFVEVKDFVDQSDITSYILQLPIKSFNNKASKEVMAIRNEVAKNKISIKLAKDKLLDLFSSNKSLLKDPIVKKSYEETLLIMNPEEAIVFSINNALFKKLFELAAIVHTQSTPSQLPVNCLGDAATGVVLFYQDYRPFL